MRKFLYFILLASLFSCTAKENPNLNSSNDNSDIQSGLNKEAEESQEISISELNDELIRYAEKYNGTWWPEGRGLFSSGDSTILENLTELSITAINLIEIIGVERTTMPTIPNLNPVSKLKSFRASSCQISDISNLEGIEISEVYLQNNPISDIDPLYNMEGLEVLDIDGTNVSHLGDMSKWKSIKQIRISESLINSLDNIECQQRS